MKKTKNKHYGIYVREGTDREIRRVMNGLKREGERVSRSELIDTVLNVFFASEDATTENITNLIRTRRKGIPALKGEMEKNGTGFVSNTAPAPKTFSENQLQHQEADCKEGDRQ